MDEEGESVPSFAKTQAECLLKFVKSKAWFHQERSVNSSK